jgi:hypothetical protein
MNLFGLLSLFAALAILTWFFGNGIESVQEENTPEQGVFENTLDAAQNAADSISN